MKQSKRLLCVLLALVLMLSALTVGASAYKTSYERPAGYDSILDPYFSNDQAASALLDYLDDEVFAGMDVHEEILGISIDIYSLDSLFDSINNITTSTLYGVASILNLGDIEDMNWEIPEDGNFRRRSTSLSDLEFFGKFLQFAQQNADPLYKLIGNDLDLGIIGNFVDLGEMIPMLDDLHGFLTYTVYNLLIDPDMAEENYDKANSNLDDIIQDFLNNRCIKFICDMLADEETGENPVADFLGLPTNPDGTLAEQMGILGLCPSLKAEDISITETSIYAFCRNIFSALIDDVVVPFAGTLIVDLLEIPLDDPTAEEMSYVDMVINLFVTYETVGLPETATPEEIMVAFLTQQGCPNPEAPNNLDKINVGIEYILKEGITQYLYLQDDGMGGKYLTIAPDVMNQLAGLLKGVLPMLPSLLDDFKVLSEEEIAALDTMNDEQVFAFAIQMVLEAFVDGIYFPHNCNSIKELATYTLIDLCADYIPEVDFEAEIEEGRLDPNSMQCLDVAAALLRYFIVEQLGYIPGNTVESYQALIDNPMPSFTQLLNGVFDQLLGKYAVLFNLYPHGDADKVPSNTNSPWYKLYRTVGQVVPLTNIFYGVEDSPLGMENLFIDSIIGNILDFDINGLLSIIGARPDSELNKPLSKALIDLVARVVNGLFRLTPEEESNLTDNAQQKALIIPYAYNTLDEFLIEANTTSTDASYPQRYNSNAAVSGCGLQNTVKMLLNYITNITGPGTLAGESLDLLATLIGIIDLDVFDYIKIHYEDNATAGTTYTIEELKELYNELKLPNNDGLKYYDESYGYFTDVDYAPWAFKKYEDVLESVEGIINAYDAHEADPNANAAPARSDITYAYYSLYYTYDDIVKYYPTTANDYQLEKFYNKVVDAGYTNVNEDGTQKYTSRSWDLFDKAMTFATKVMDEYATYEAQGILGDYRQSKINMARRQLRDAVGALKINTGDADYSEIEAQLARITYLANPMLFTDKSVQEVLDSYKKALEFNSEIKYDIDSQIIVDGVANALRDAIDGLQAIPVIEFYMPDVNHVDHENKFLYGMPEDYYNAEEAEMWGNDFWSYFMVYYGSPTGGDYMTIEPTANGNGTGAKINIATTQPDGSLDIDTQYTVVIFGDVNGDTFIDGEDAVVMRAYAASMLRTGTSTKHIQYAGDLNYDGSIGTSDAKLVENAGLKKTTVDQLPTVYTEKTTTFLDLLS